MFKDLRKHLVTIVVATVAAVVAAGGIVGAHNNPSGGHVTFSHKTQGFKPLPLKKVSSSAADASDETAREEADEIPLFSKGPLSVYAKCFTNDSSNPLVKGEIYIRTTQGGAIFNSADEDSSSNAFLTPSTVEDQRQLVTTASADAAGTVNLSDPEDGPFFAAAGSLQVNGLLFVGTKVGQPAVGNGLFGSGNRRCVFGGSITSR
jgi:hypothetical protein